MNPEFYVTIDGAQQGTFMGDSNRPAHQGKIVGLAFNYEVSAARDVETGQTAGNNRHSPLTITKHWGPSTPQIFQALLTNEVLKSVLLEFVHTAPDGTEYVSHEITLSDATIIKIRQHTDADMLKLEDVSFIFKKIKIENKDGKTQAEDNWSHN